jgi:single-stranded DNA-binding protein
MPRPGWQWWASVRVDSTLQGRWGSVAGRGHPVHDRDRLAENVAESAQRGTRVIMTGRLRQRSYDTREDGKATVYELDAADLGISLQRTTAKPASKMINGQFQDHAGGEGGWPC